MPDQTQPQNATQDQAQTQDQIGAPPQFAAPTRNFEDPAPPPAPRTTRDDATEADFDELAGLIARRMVVTVRGRTAASRDELKSVLASKRVGYVAPEPLGTPTLIHGGLIEGIHVALTGLSDQIKAQGDQIKAQDEKIAQLEAQLAGQDAQQTNRSYGNLILSADITDSADAANPSQDTADGPAPDASGQGAAPDASSESTTPRPTPKKSGKTV